MRPNNPAGGSDSLPLEGGATGTDSCGQGDGAAGWARQPHRTVWSGCMPDPGSAARPPGGQYGQPSDERQYRSQPTEGSEEPAGLSARVGSPRRGGRLGGCSAGDEGALPGQLLEGGVQGGLLLRGLLSRSERRLVIPVPLPCQCPLGGRVCGRLTL